MSSIVRSARAHIVELDGLRAIAAFAVVIHHVGFDTAARFSVVWEQLDIGVAVFFVLSGFLLGAPFVRRLIDDEPIVGIGRFWFRRAVRIYPAYWVVLLCMIAFLGTSIGSVYEAVMLFGLLQIYDPDLFFAGMVQAWTLAVEISFYAVLPLLALGAAAVLRRSGTTSRARALLIGCVLLYLASTLWRLAMYWLPPQWGRLGMSWLPGQFDLFALGLAVAVVRAWSDRDGAIAERVARAVRRPAVWFAGALLVFVLLCVLGLRRPVVPVDSPLEFGDGREFARQIAFGVVALLLVAPMALRHTRVRGVAGVLATAPMVTLGVLSYGVYLWHKSLIPKAQALFDLQPFGGGFLRVFLVVAVVSTALAWCTWRLVERPALALARRDGLRTRETDDGEPARNAPQPPGQPPFGSS